MDRWGRGVELRQLSYFTAVADELSFARAAERLHIVQPAVSQQIRRLERDLGVQLFDRTSRRVRLTAAGERLLAEARSVLAASDRMRQQAAELASGGLLRLGTSQGLGERLPRLLAEVARSAPALRVELVSLPAEQRLTMVRAGRLDAAFVRARPAARDLDLLPLWTEPLVAALPATHPSAARATVELQQLRDLPLRLVRREHNAAFHDFVVGACAAAGFEPTLGPPFTNVQDTLADVAAGPPTWTALYAAAADQIAMSRVSFRPVTGAAGVPTLLAVRAGASSAVLRHLLDACAAIGSRDFASVT
jgi:DNA-binding transcriptional LysR family regulator